MSVIQEAVVPQTHAYRIVHRTRYDFDHAVEVGRVALRLTPRDLPCQRCEFHQIVTRPLATARQEALDCFGNSVVQLGFPTALPALEVSAISRVVVTDRVHVPADETPPWEQLRESPHEGDECDGGWSSKDKTEDPGLHKQLTHYAMPSFRPGRPILAAAEDLMSRIFNEFTYDPNATSLATSVAELLRHKRGVCQDFATVMIAMLRAVGLAARYVSGYVDRMPDDSRRVIGTNAAHAWCALRVPGSNMGWIGLDPTYNCRVGTRHVTLAWGRNYDDVAPLTGSVGGGAGQRMTVSVDVERLTSTATVAGSELP